jgi:hypothetical protein
MEKSTIKRRRGSGGYHGRFAGLQEKYSPPPVNLAQFKELYQFFE